MTSSTVNERREEKKKREKVTIRTTAEKGGLRGTHELLFFFLICFSLWRLPWVFYSSCLADHLLICRHTAVSPSCFPLSHVKHLYSASCAAFFFFSSYPHPSLLSLSLASADRLMAFYLSVFFSLFFPARSFLKSNSARFFFAFSG